MNENIQRVGRAVADHWSSRLGFILAATGAAVGLGNIWKFPYMVGENGGAAFVLVYLICTVMIGLPVMLAEILIGRRGQSNAVDSLEAVAKESSANCRWSYLGWWGAVTLLLTLSFYSVVASWSLAYIVRAWSGVFVGLTANEINVIWSKFISNPLEMLLWDSVFMVMTLAVVMGGVQGGLERASRFMMPMLFIVLLILVGYATSTGSYFIEAVHYLFSFDIHKITGSVVISAMGHCFFTLAVGAGCMLVYGSYLSKQTQVFSTVLIIALLNVLVALLAGLAIFPLLFTHHLPAESGPGLMFQVLPIAFSQMSYGSLIGGLFFVLVLFAAWTSSISLAEPIVVLLKEHFGFTRCSASCWTGVVAWVISIACLLSFNLWNKLYIMGHWNIFTATTDLVTNIMLPIGGLGFSIFAAWLMKIKFSSDELRVGTGGLFYSWLFLARFVAPLGILVILIAAL